MKYCLLLCGILMSSIGFAQSMPDNPGAIASDGALVKPSDSAAVSSTSNIISKTVFATYYARKFEGRRTTSGARYRASKMTAAHLTLPFGTIVTVTNPENGKSVEVEVNDRGPHSKKFKIDLSAAAAKALGFFGKGVAELQISYVSEED